MSARVCLRVKVAAEDADEAEDAAIIMSAMSNALGVEVSADVLGTNLHVEPGVSWNSSLERWHLNREAKRRRIRP